MEEELIARVTSGKRSHNDNSEYANATKRICVKRGVMTRSLENNNKITGDEKVACSQLTTLDRLHDDLIKPILNYGLAYHDIANLWCLGNRRLQIAIKRLVEFVYLTPCVLCNPQYYKSTELGGTRLAVIYRTFENEESKVPLLNSQLLSKDRSTNTVTRDVSLSELNQRLLTCKCQSISPKIVPCIKTIIASPALTLQNIITHNLNFKKFTVLEHLELRHVDLHTVHKWTIQIRAKHMFVKPTHLPPSIREVLFMQKVEFVRATTHNLLPNLKVIRSSHGIQIGKYLPAGVVKMTCDGISCDVKLPNVIELKLGPQRCRGTNIANFPSLKKLSCDYSYLLVSELHIKDIHQGFLADLETLKLMVDDNYFGSDGILVPLNIRHLKVSYNTRFKVGLNMDQCMRILLKQILHCSKLERIQIKHPQYRPDELTGVRYVPDEVVFAAIKHQLSNSLSTTNHCDITNVYFK